MLRDVYVGSKMAFVFTRTELVRFRPVSRVRGLIVFASYTGYGAPVRKSRQGMLSKYPPGRGT